MRSTVVCALAALALLCASGCGKPQVYPVTGKVTLAGKPRERLIVYFRPVSGAVNEYNLGVGETDKDGNLRLGSAAGGGLAAGEYKVTFTYQTTKSGRTFAASEKPDEVGVKEVVEMVADEYADRTAAETTTVRFTVKSKGDNEFNYDVPARK